MEYEIGDDPQGLPERRDGDRDGGLREDRIPFGYRPSAPSFQGHDNPESEDTSSMELGEAR